MQVSKNFLAENDITTIVTRCELFRRARRDTRESLVREGSSFARVRLL